MKKFLLIVGFVIFFIICYINTSTNEKKAVMPESTTKEKIIDFLLALLITAAGTLGVFGLMWGTFYGCDWFANRFPKPTAIILSLLLCLLLAVLVLSAIGTVIVFAVIIIGAGLTLIFTPVNFLIDKLFPISKESIFDLGRELRSKAFEVKRIKRDKKITVAFLKKYHSERKLRQMFANSEIELSELVDLMNELKQKRKDSRQYWYKLLIAKLKKFRCKVILKRTLREEKPFKRLL